MTDSWVRLCFHVEEQEQEQEEEEEEPSPKKINFYITQEAEIWYVSLIQPNQKKYEVKLGSYPYWSGGGGKNGKNASLKETMNTTVEKDATANDINDESKDKLGYFRVKTLKSS